MWAFRNNLPRARFAHPRNSRSLLRYRRADGAARNLAHHRRTETLVLLGRSGSGKTTLLKTVNGLVRPNV
jgi:ABC-type sulfate/molybdate transport systems ATPase subunit